jgi:sigma-B regulation protein RsbU (phosphoserine phosphatase)
MPPREREALVRLCEQAVEIAEPTYEFLTRPGSALLLYAQPLRVGEKIVGAAWSGRWLPETPVGALSTWALPATIAAALVGITVALWTAIQLQRGLMRMQAGLELGREMIASLMPAEALEVQGYEIARRVEPATEVGGDFYNLFPLDGQSVGVVLGDIAGKGVAAALGMAVVTTLLEEQARSGISPADVLARSSQKLAARLRARRTFATAVYGRLDLAAHTISLCSAGQTPCIWLREGEASYVRIPGTPLGRIGDGTYQEETLELGAGDTLVFATDGFVEMRNGHGRPLGYDGWLKLVEQHRDCAPGEMVERLFAAVGASMRDPSERDDLTLLVLRRNG